MTLVELDLYLWAASQFLQCLKDNTYLWEVGIWEKIFGDILFQFQIVKTGLCKSRSDLVTTDFD